MTHEQERIADLLERRRERKNEIDAIVNLPPKELREKIDRMLNEQEYLYQDPVLSAAEELNRYGGSPEPFALDVLQVLCTINDDMKHVRSSEFILENKARIVKLIDDAHAEYVKEWWR